MTPSHKRLGNTSPLHQFDAHVLEMIVRMAGPRMSEVLETLSGSMLSWNITQQAETSETVTRFTSTQAQQEQEQSAEKADPWPRLRARETSANEGGVRQVTR